MTRLLINDDVLATPTLNISNVLINEGDSGTSSVDFTVELDITAPQQLSVGYTTVDGSAIAGSDYVFRSGRLTILQGESSGVISITINSDTIAESDGDFQLQLSDPLNASIQSATATATILNDDADPVPELPTVSIADSNIREGDSGSQNMQFVVTLNKAATESVSIGYQSSAGTATSTTDFTAVNSSITINAGSTQGTIFVAVNGDTEIESDETFTLSLNNPVNVIIADGNATGIIINDDSDDTPQALPDNWYFFGDSETAGTAVAAEQPTARSPAITFENIWGGTTPQLTVDGESGGVGLQRTTERYELGSNYHSDDWVHFQESGNQDKDGQRTVDDYIATFDAFVRKILVNSPDAIISTETAYSFEREAIAWRDWTAYNAALRQKVTELQAENINIYLADIDDDMKELVSQLSFDVVITDDGGHYRGVGNLLIALAIYKELGYDIEGLDLSVIPDVSDAHKTLCIQILEFRAN